MLALFQHEPKLESTSTGKVVIAFSCTRSFPVFLQSAPPQRRACSRARSAAFLLCVCTVLPSGEPAQRPQAGVLLHVPMMLSLCWGHRFAATHISDSQKTHRYLHTHTHTHTEVHVHVSCIGHTSGQHHQSGWETFVYSAYTYYVDATGVHNERNSLM